MDDALLSRFAALFAARPRHSDSRICAELGITLTEAHRCANALRALHGLSATDNLRAFLRGAQ